MIGVKQRTVVVDGVEYVIRAVTERDRRGAFKALYVTGGGRTVRFTPEHRFYTAVLNVLPHGSPTTARLLARIMEKVSD